MGSKRERIAVYDLSGRLLGDEYREEYYRRIGDLVIRGRPIQTRIHVVHCIAQFLNGDVAIQQRCMDKENSGLFDKTVGGHVLFNEQPHYALKREYFEELGRDNIIIADNAEYLTSCSSFDFSRGGLFRCVDNMVATTSLRYSPRIMRFYELPILASFYLGYDDRTKFTPKDGECAHLWRFKLDDLLNAVDLKPNKFTADLIRIMETYKEQCGPLCRAVE